MKGSSKSAREDNRFEQLSRFSQFLILMFFTISIIIFLELGTFVSAFFYILQVL